MHTLVLIRHGQSQWNLENRFTGWADVDLTEQGIAEAREAGRLLAEAGFDFDLAHTSVLKRAVRTLWHVQDVMDRMWLPVRHRLASQRTPLRRADGPEQGRDRGQVRRRAGACLAAQLRHAAAGRWKRRTTSFAADPRYAGLGPAQVPLTECLKDTVARVLPYWHEVAGADHPRRTARAGAAHGNSMRALVKYLDGISDDDIAGVNIPNGVPLVYEFDADMQPVKHYYLGDADALEAKMQAVANQGKRQGLRSRLRRSERVAVQFAGADADHLLQRADEDLAVADLAGACRLLDGLHGAVDHVVGHGGLELDLGQEVDHVLGAAVELGMALLAAEALDLGDGQSLHADVGQRLAHVVELERLDDGGDQLHAGPGLRWDLGAHYTGNGGAVTQAAGPLTCV